MVLVNYQSNMDIASGKTEDKVLLVIINVVIQNYIKLTLKVILSSSFLMTIIFMQKPYTGAW